MDDVDDPWVRGLMGLDAQGDHEKWLEGRRLGQALDNIRARNLEVVEVSEEQRAVQRARFFAMLDQSSMPVQDVPASVTTTETSVTPTLDSVPVAATPALHVVTSKEIPKPGTSGSAQGIPSGRKYLMPLAIAAGFVAIIFMTPSLYQGPDNAVSGMRGGGGSQSFDVAQPVVEAQRLAALFAAAGMAHRVVSNPDGSQRIDVKLVATDAASAQAAAALTALKDLGATIPANHELTVVLRPTAARK